MSPPQRSQLLLQVFRWTEKWADGEIQTASQHHKPLPYRVIHDDREECENVYREHRWAKIHRISLNFKSQQEQQLPRPRCVALFACDVTSKELKTWTDFVFSGGPFEIIASAQQLLSGNSIMANTQLAWSQRAWVQSSCNPQAAHITEEQMQQVQGQFPAPANPIAFIRSAGSLSQEYGGKRKPKLLLLKKAAYGWNYIIVHVHINWWLFIYMCKSVTLKSTVVVLHWYWIGFVKTWYNTSKPFPYLECINHMLCL